MEKIKTPVNFKLLSNSQKSRISNHVASGKLSEIVSLLDAVSTPHAGTARTKDKRFVVKELVRQISGKADHEKEFFELGKYLCESESDNAKEIGVSLVWKGFRYNKKETKKLLLKIADDNNWEVREYAGGAFANVLRANRILHKTMLKWTKHESENVRRAVLFSSLAYKTDKDVPKAFEIMSLLMNDGSKYVKRNLGPFILGSHFGNTFPDHTFRFLKSKSRSDNPDVLWNIAMSFNNSFGNRYPDKALGILRMVCKPNIPGVNRAVVSTIRHLSRGHGELAETFCRENNITLKGKAPQNGRLG